MKSGNDKVRKKACKKRIRKRWHENSLKQVRQNIHALKCERVEKKNRDLLERRLKYILLKNTCFNKLKVVKNVAWNNYTNSQRVIKYGFDCKLLSPKRHTRNVKSLIVVLSVWLWSVWST